MANGDLIKLGTFYMDNVKRARPTMPWQNGNTPTGAPGAGNIPKYTSGNLEIKDTDSSDAYRINWIEVNDGDKKLLIADRNILVNVSWDTLNAQGLIFGKDVTIDGQKYKLRVLTGGSYYRTGTDYYSGGTPTTNEWDRIITNESSFSGLPKPNTTDLDTSQNETDRLGTHNSKWNWYLCNSWCQETREGAPSFRSYRGYDSARCCGFNASSAVFTSFGWRPVLEVLNSTPLISGSDGSLGELSEPLVKTYSVSDTDGDNFSIVEKLNGEEIRTLENQVDGNFTLDLTSHFGKLSKGTHTVEIIATDTNGASTKRTWTFIINSVTGNLEFKTLKQDVDYQPMLISIIDKSIFRKSQGEDLKITVKVCNNANDDLIVWEDATENYLSGKPYTFMNETKTADKWSVIVHYKIEAKNYIGGISISSIGIGVI